MVYAVFSHPSSGYDSDIKFAKAMGLVLNKKYVMADASVGRCNSKVKLDGIDSWFTSVQFDFIDEKGNKVDIYQDKQYNAYNRIN